MPTERGVASDAANGPPAPPESCHGFPDRRPRARRGRRRDGGARQRRPDRTDTRRASRPPALDRGPVGRHARHPAIARPPRPVRRRRDAAGRVAACDHRSSTHPTDADRGVGCSAAGRGAGRRSRGEPARPGPRRGRDAGRRRRGCPAGDARAPGWRRPRLDRTAGAPGAGDVRVRQRPTRLRSRRRAERQPPRSAAAVVTHAAASGNAPGCFDRQPDDRRAGRGRHGDAGRHRASNADAPAAADHPQAEADADADP